jgi:hypothetical protein
VLLCEFCFMSPHLTSVKIIRININEEANVVNTEYNMVYNYPSYVNQFYKVKPYVNKVWLLLVLIASQEE